MAKQVQVGKAPKLATQLCRSIQYTMDHCGGEIKWHMSIGAIMADQGLHVIFVGKNED